MSVFIRVGRTAVSVSKKGAKLVKPKPKKAEKRKKK